MTSSWLIGGCGCSSFGDQRVGVAWTRARISRNSRKGTTSTSWWRRHDEGWRHYHYQTSEESKARGSSVHPTMTLSWWCLFRVFSLYASPLGLGCCIGECRVVSASVGCGSKQRNIRSQLHPRARGRESIPAGKTMRRRRRKTKCENWRKRIVVRNKEGRSRKQHRREAAVKDKKKRITKRTTKEK